MTFSHPSAPPHSVLAGEYAKLSEEELAAQLQRDHSGMVYGWTHHCADSVHISNVKHWAALEALFDQSDPTPPPQAV